jgi:hypothetical protein
MPTKRKAKPASIHPMPTTKKGKLHYLLVRNAMSVAEIAKELGVGKVAAYSLVSDVKKMPNVKMLATMKDGVMTYQVAAEWSPEDLAARDKRKAKCFGKKQDAPTGDAEDQPKAG